MEFLIFQFMPIASLILPLGSTEKHLAPSSLFYEIPLSLFFSRLCNHSSFILSCQLPQSLNHLHGLSLDLLECACVSLVLRSPGQDSTVGGSLLCWAEGKHQLPGPAGTALPNVAQDAVGFHCQSMHCRLLFNLLPIRTWFLLCLEIVSRVIWYMCRMKEKVWNNSDGDDVTLETSVWCFAGAEVLWGLVKC